ncbi:DUF72 domain-containing protein [Halomonas icarae]|uniref:DUF72 domain-containing protein n=1 Tax=Halomonas icarae TaxID=2691040 RepID=A0A7X4W071_9GAMM|nr:DUF72 domain-containing protein [Halomonas icarae]MDR5902900.1 DUF72 domain-containing protein [Halomonas icarae]NAW13476.1 DUF72 domain-containing protein [Halomonas icarae]
MWANPDWRGGLYPPHGGGLEEYARAFTCVEGNTTFYSGAPRPETVAAWARQAPPGFRFCFKLPAALTHERRLVDIEAELDVFLTALEPLHDRLGPLMIQLPRDFGGDELPRLEALLARWPSDIPCAVEVRHTDFFHKGSVERHFNRMLITQGVDRVMLDVRPLFATPAGEHPGVQQAQREKPKRPLHVLSTGSRPLVRYIGHHDAAINEHYFAAWIERLSLWIKQGKTPYLMVHTPDNRQAPQLARRLHDRLAERLALPPLPAFPGEAQASLFGT